MHWILIPIKQLSCVQCDYIIKTLIFKFLTCAWCMILIVDMGFFVVIECNCFEGGILIYNIDTP